MARSYTSQNGGRLAGAIALAAEIHQHQYDKGGRPYILHPIRVMEMLKEKDEDWQIVAVLHDTIEDHPGTPEEVLDFSNMLEGEFGVGVRNAVSALSRVPEEDYFDYIGRVKEWPITRAVKLADLKDNMDILRQPSLDDRALRRLMKYHTAYRILRERE